MNVYTHNSDFAQYTYQTTSSKQGLSSHLTPYENMKNHHMQVNQEKENEEKFRLSKSKLLIFL